MKIDPLNAYTPAPGGHSSKKTRSDGPKPRDVDIFSGPNTGNLLQDLRRIESARPELVQQLREEIATGSYLSEDKLRKVVEKLASSL